MFKLFCHVVTMLSGSKSDLHQVCKKFMNWKRRIFHYLFIFSEESVFSAYLWRRDLA